MPTGASATEAQEDALARLRKRHKDAPGVLVSHFDPMGRMVVMLPGEESITRRRRFITRSGVVESRV